MTRIGLLGHARARPAHPSSCKERWIAGSSPAMTPRRVAPASPSPMQAELVRRRPGPPMVVRHLDVGRAEELEGVVDRVREARHAADIRALADALGADRMMR